MRSEVGLGNHSWQHSALHTFSVDNYSYSALIHIFTVSLQELHMSEQSCEVNKLVTDLTPGCKACLYFYVGMMNDTNKTKQDSVAVSLPTVT